jgi:hypothetical protein
MIKDIAGHEVKVGDTIALAVRLGNSAYLSTYEILSIEEAKDKYMYNRIPVRAKQLSAHWANYTDRDSILYGELFEERALVIYP